ncbi:GlsB/YeaQ/YmgE family stress response membrane protein [Salipiger pacificus]|nr:GlsB/YeaQ/YmgE family stress response membrane protein [Alloyangia pacifica]MCA0943608.1 GlsB/YeaQ/YmgE family stress response membrane protein [Alloyangia pacifica]
MRKLHILAAAALAAPPAWAQETTGTATGDAMASGGNALVGLLITLIIGAIVGWLASVIMKGGGSGIVMDIILGIGGALVAGWLFPMIGVSFGAGLIPSIIAAVIGAIILILIVRLLRGAAR